jgi:trimeric autotransporter adhesin
LLRVCALCRLWLSSVRFLALVFGLGAAALLNGCGGGNSGSGASAGDSTTSPTPAVSSISPTTMTAGSAALTLTVSGSGFLNTSVVKVGTTAEPTTYISATQLSATVPATQLASGAQLAVVVVNGSVSSGSGSPVNLEVDNPAPTIAAVSPASEVTGASSPVLTVTGTGFVPTTVIDVNGTTRTTTFISSTQVSVALTAADLSAAASLSLTAVNPTPGGGTSTAAAVAVVASNPAPSITSVNPATELVGASSPVIAVTGTGFNASTVVDVNGSARTTTFSSATQVNVTLTAADVAATGSLSLAAVNPAPGGGTSAAVHVEIDNPPVGTIQVKPSTLTAGGTTPAVLTVTGDRFVTASTVQVNGTARATTYVNVSTLTFVATVADQASAGTLAVTVTNPAPGGGTSPVANVSVVGPGVPAITSVSPNSFTVGAPGAAISVAGTGFTTQSVVEWNGAALATSPGYNSATEILATVPAADLATAGTATVTVNTPGSNPSLSNSITVNITNPLAPTLTSISPSGGPINTAATVNLIGAGFTTNSTVALNGQQIASTYLDSTQLTVTIPASSTAIPGNFSLTVITPAPGGGTSSPLAYTTYIQMPNNDIAYNPTDGLLYVSVPTSAGSVAGNSVVGMDPATGNVIRQIWVGSNPDRLAISTDGTQLFVGLDGAAAVAQVDLTQGKVVNQFSLGGGEGIYNPPFTALYLAAVPGLPNSVAVALAGSFDGNGTGVTIFDSGVARPNPSSGVGYGPISFGSSASTLYMAGTSVDQLTVNSSGVSTATSLSSVSGQMNSIQYDSGQLYLSTGGVLNASTGALLGTFYSSAPTAANGPVVSDSALGRAFIAVASPYATGEVMAFDESNFNLIGSIPVNGIGPEGYPTTFRKMVRWGQNGVAINTVPAAYSDTNQIYIFQSPLVKDLSPSPADLSVSLSAPATAATGTAVSWVATINNVGPNTAQGARLVMNLDSSLIINSVTASQGACGTGTAFTCDLGNLANGASTAVTVSATPSNSGTLAGVASVSSTSYDPTLANNQSTSSTTVTGNVYGAVPSVSAISPNLVQAGSTDFTLTVTGTGFNGGSTVNLDTTPLPTTYVSATQLTASVSASEVANYGWAAITVSNPLPGGGISQIQPLTIYGLVNVPASGLIFDPYSQLLYATIPSTATTLTGNSIVSIDPVTGTVGAPIPIGSEPTVMTETSDGNYLWVGLSGADSVAQFDLLHQSLKSTVPLSITQYGSTTGVAATWLAAMPGTDTTLAVGGYGIFDISSNSGSFRTNNPGGIDGVNPVFADASHVYTYDSLSTGFEFYRYNVDANGLTLIDGTTLDGMGGFSGGFQLADGLIYGAGGGIANPATTPPSQIATLPTVDFYQAGITTSGVGTVADPSLQKEFLMTENAAGTWAYGLARYDLTTYLPEALLEMPASASSVLAQWTMFRWGQDGLAMLSYADFGLNQPVVVVMLMRGPFVTPQLLQTSSAASLTSSSTLTHGNGNTMLTLTGANFLPGVAVTWNGSYRTTTIVDATHVSVAVPASDLTNTGTVSLVATNPGAPGSNVLQITIN